MLQLQSAFGVLALLAIAWALSDNRRAVSLRQMLVGLVATVVTALVLLKLPPRVRLVLVRGPGTGKREGLARALRAISLQGAPAEAVVIVQDGDAVLPPGCLARTLPFFRLLPALAALTTDEDCVVPGAGPAMRAWHRLRFAQRHLLMSSMALSRRLITLTGRMSAYRANVATDPTFIETIQHDRLDHWRHGRLRPGQRQPGQHHPSRHQRHRRQHISQNG